jgi:hypothetical protein
MIATGLVIWSVFSGLTVTWNMMVTLSPIGMVPSDSGNPIVCGEIADEV